MRKVKGVSFDLEDPHEKALFDHFEKIKFSPFVKSLITAHIKGAQTKAVLQDVEAAPQFDTDEDYGAYV